MELLLEQGHRVAVLDLQGNTNATSTNPNHLLSISGDVCSEDDVQAAIDRILSSFGRLDVLVNCAGILLVHPIYNESTEEVHSLKEFQKILNVNVSGTFNVIRLTVAAMMKTAPPEAADGQRGVIINVSSVAGLDGASNMLAYSAAKAAIAGMTLPLARELGKFGIRVLSIAPGAFLTPIVADVEAAEKRAVNNAFPHRMGEPKEFAMLVKAIIENPYLNGDVIRLDAGLRAIAVR